MKLGVTNAPAPERFARGEGSPATVALGRDAEGYYTATYGELVETRRTAQRAVERVLEGSVRGIAEELRLRGRVTLELVPSSGSPS